MIADTIVPSPLPSHFPLIGDRLYLFILFSYLVFPNFFSVYFHFATFEFFNARFSFLFTDFFNILILHWVFNRLFVIFFFCRSLRQEKDEVKTFAIFFIILRKPTGSQSFTY